MRDQAACMERERSERCERSLQEPRPGLVVERLNRQLVVIELCPEGQVSHGDAGNLCATRLR